MAWRHYKMVDNPIHYFISSLYIVMAAPTPSAPGTSLDRGAEIEQLRRELTQIQGCPADELRILRRLTELLLTEKEMLENVVRNQSASWRELDRDRDAWSFECRALRKTVRRLKWRLKKDPWVSTSEDSDSD